MGRSVALGDAEARVVAQLWGKFGGVAQESCDVVLLAKTCSEGSRADSACKGLSVCGLVAVWERRRTRSADDEDLHGYDGEDDQVKDLATKAINPRAMKPHMQQELADKLDP